MFKDIFEPETFSSKCHIDDASSLEQEFYP